MEFNSRLIEVLDASRARADKNGPTKEITIEDKALSVFLFQLELSRCVNMTAPAQRDLRREFTSLVLALGGYELATAVNNTVKLFHADAMDILANRGNHE